MNEALIFLEVELKIAMENDNRPRIFYTVKERGKDARTIASPCLEMGNPNQIAWALRQLAEMIEQPNIDPVSYGN